MPAELPPIPNEFLVRMQARLGGEFPEFLRALDAPAEGLRINPLRISVEEFGRVSPFPVSKLAGVEEGFVLGDRADAGRHPYHAGGVYYLQDPGAMAVGALTGTRPGERVLDLSAAPGGKATHLGSRMAGNGVLVANDVNRARARELVGNIERFGIRNAIVTAEAPERLAERLGRIFDRVLVDAPCSGESMFHKSRAAREEWSPEAVEGCSRRQKELLGTAARLVTPAGLLVYSTCTFSREENEEVVERFLREHGEFEPALLDELEGAEAAGPTPSPGAGASAYRFWPHRFPGAGHFIAALRRTDDARVYDAPLLRPVLEREVRSLVLDFMERTFEGEELDPGRLARFGDDVVLLPPIPLDLSGLAVLRSGLLLGSVLPGRFEPAHALALAAPPLRSSSVIDLPVDDHRVARYLEGQTIEAAGPDGWVMIAVAGYRLGWGKRVGMTVKNHYPRGLRRRA